MFFAIFFGFFQLCLILMNCSEIENIPLDSEVALGNILKMFRYFSNNYNFNEFQSYGRELFRLNDKHPVKLMEIVRDSHSITFNYMFWEILHLRNIIGTRNFVTRGDVFFHVHFKKDKILKLICSGILYEAKEKLGRLGVKAENQAGNQESLESIKIMMEILKEFANKIQNRKKGLKIMTLCDGIAFITENISIDYEKGSIDYNAFIGAFHEFKTLYPLRDSCKEAKKRCEKLKKLIYFYTKLIKQSNCSFLFDFDNSEELIFLVLQSLQGFREITVTPNNKRTYLIHLYEEVLSNHSCFIKSYSPLLMGRKILEVTIADSGYFIKNYFFTKLSNFLALQG